METADYILTMRGFVVLLNFRCRFILFFEAVDAISCMAMPKCLDMIFEGPLVLEIWPTSTVPKFPTVLLVGSPVTSHSKGLTTLPTHERLDSMLSLVMGLKGSEVFEWSWSWMIDVVPAPGCTAKAWEFKHGRWLCSPQRLWPFSILRSMPPHMHLQHEVFWRQVKLVSYKTKTIHSIIYETLSW